MQLEPIQIPRHISNQLMHLAQISPKAEICGLIGSIDGIASHCYPITNVSKHPQQRFLLDAKQQITAMSSMRERGEQLFAIYHSHPTTPAIPSQTDLAQASYPEALYLIISLSVKGILEIRGFKIVDQNIQEFSLTIKQD